MIGHKNGMNDVETPAKMAKSFILNINGLSLNNIKEFVRPVPGPTCCSLASLCVFRLVAYAGFE